MAWDREKKINKHKALLTNYKPNASPFTQVPKHSIYYSATYYIIYIFQQWNATFCGMYMSN